MRTLLCALIAAACVVLPTLAQPKGEQKPAKRADDKPLNVNDDAKKLLETMQDHVEAYVSSNRGLVPNSLTKDVGLKPEELAGEKFSVRDKVYWNKSHFGLVAEPKDAADGYHLNKFALRGDFWVRVYRSLDQLKAENDDFEWEEAKKVDRASEAEKGNKRGQQWDALFKKGAKWTWKLSYGTDMWMSVEVIEVEDSRATIRNSVKWGEAGEWGRGEESKIPRPEPGSENASANEAGYKEIARGDEKVGDWECEFIESEVNGMRTKKYYHKKYGLLMKVVEGDTVKQEITAFEPVE